MSSQPFEGQGAGTAGLLPEQQYPAQPFSQESSMSMAPDPTYPIPPTADQIEQQIRAQQGSINQLNDGLVGFQASIEHRFSGLAEALNRLEAAAAAATAPAPPERPIPQGTTDPHQAQQQPVDPLVAAFNHSVIKDFNKRVYSFPEGSKLQGPSNFDQWRQALAVQFRALGMPRFIEDPSMARGLSDPDQAIILMLLRDSCTEGPQAAITWQRDPEQAYRLLTKQYSYSADI